MINMLLEKIARWYYLNYLRALILDDLKARAAVEAMRPQKRYVGE